MALSPDKSGWLLHPRQKELQWPASAPSTGIQENSSPHGYCFSERSGDRGDRSFTCFAEVLKVRGVVHDAASAGMTLRTRHLYSTSGVRVGSSSSAYATVWPYMSVVFTVAIV